MLNRATLAVLSSCGRSRCLSKCKTNFKGSEFLQQPTNSSALRILQTYTANRSVCSSSRSLPSNRKHEDPSTKHGHSVSELEQHNSEKHQPGQKLRSWSFTVDSFAKIVIQTAFNVIVKSVNPLDYPAADKAFISLTLKSGKVDDSLFETVTSSLQANVNYKDEQLFVEGHFVDINDELEKQVQGASVVWIAEVPLSFDADIQTSDDGTIVLENLENQSCVVKSENGNCHINKVKSGDIKISSSGNVIIKNVLQGNAHITTYKSGSITTDRLQGQTFVLSSQGGSISCKDVYAIKTEVKTTSGHIQLANVHGECDIKTPQGNVDIGSLDGSLNAVTDTGNISAYLVQHKDVNISSQNGDVSLKVPGDIKTAVHLEASTVSVCQELHTQSVRESQSSDRAVFSGVWSNEDTNQLKAVTKHGSISVAVQSWFDSLQLSK